MNDSSSDRTPDAEQGRGGDWLCWTAGLGLVATLSIVAAHLPPNFRRLVLSVAILGAASGAVVTFLTQICSVQTTVKTICLAALLGTTSVVIYHWQSLRLLKNHAVARVESHPDDLMKLSILEAGLENDPSQLPRVREFRLTLRPTLVDYLIYRLSGIGEWRVVGATMFAGFEACLAGALCAIVVFMSRRPRPGG